MKDIITTIALIALTITAAFAANNSVDNFVKLHDGEYKYVKKSIQDSGVQNFSKDSKIYITASDKEKTKYFSEFTYLTSRFKGSVYMVKLALYELGIDSTIPVNFIENDNLLNRDKDTLIIDMKAYQNKAYEELDIPLALQSLF